MTGLDAMKNVATCHSGSSSARQKPAWSEPYDDNDTDNHDNDDNDDNENDVVVIDDTTRIERRLFRRF